MTNIFFLFFLAAVLPLSLSPPFESQVTISGSGDVAEKKRVSNLDNNSSKNRMKFCTSAGFIGYRGMSGILSLHSPLASQQ